MVRQRSIYRILAAGFISITALQLAMPFCFPAIRIHGPSEASILAREKAAYGKFYSDHLFCQKYTRHVGRTHQPPLSARQLNRLWELQLAPNDIAKDATLVLGSYAYYGHPEVKQEQLRRLPHLLANRSPIVRGCAATIADWAHVSRFDPQFQAIEQELKDKESLTDDEKVLLWQVKSHFGEPADPNIE